MTGAAAARTNKGAFRQLLRLFPRYRIYMPLQIGLGVIGSLAESLGISLIMLLLYTTLGADSTVAGMGGFLGNIYRYALDAVDGRTPLLAALILLLIVAKSITNLAYAMVNSWVRQALSEEVRNAVQADYLDLPYERIRQHDTGELFTILSADSWAVADASHVLTRIATNICGLLVFGGFLFAISPRLALLALTGSLIIFLLIAVFGRRAGALGQAAVDVNVALMDHMLATMQGMRAIRAFGEEASEKANFRAISRDARSTFTSIDRLSATMAPINEISYFVLLAVLILASGPLGVSVPATITAVLMLYRLQPHVRELESNRLALVGHRASLRQVLTILEPAGKRYPPPGHLPVPRLDGSIRFERVSFTYSESDAPALRDLDIDIPLKGVTAISGPSGSGKTTIINLLLRLYQPTIGRITVADLPLDDIRRIEWLGRIALAGQDADLIAGSIADNIRLGRAGATDADVREVAELAGLADFIEALSDGYDTSVGDRGLNLSGGQRQRVGLARALLRDPAVLILDEATNALEDRLEREIHDRIRARFAERAIILITHRVTGLPPADKVIELRAPSPQSFGTVCDPTTHSQEDFDDESVGG